ncbi:MAG: HAD family hydrolase [Planctomycetota bacterium]
MPVPSALIFDLDGTLVDSRADLTAAVNTVRASLGLPPHSDVAVGRMIGDGARQLLHRALDADVGPARVDEVFPQFTTAYAAVCTDQTQPYPGVRDLLAWLAAEHPTLPLAILTNKPEPMSRQILAHLELAAYFRDVIGGETLPVRKPDPAGMHELAARLGLAATDLPRMMLVGDSPVDARTAAAASCQCALCYWGFTDADVLDAEPADIRAKSVPGLQQALAARWAAAAH